MLPHDPHEGLARIRHRRAAFFATLAALPLALLVFLHAPWARAVRELLLLAWVLTWAITSMAVVWSRCPRCGRLFHNVLGFRNPLARACQSCGMSLRAE